MTNLILCHYHPSVKHQGHGITQNEIRSSGHWIVGGSSVVSNHISKCVLSEAERRSSRTEDGKLTGWSPRTSSAFYILCCGLFWSLAYQRRSLWSEALWGTVYMFSVQSRPPWSREQSFYWLISQCLSSIWKTLYPSATAAIWPRHKFCWRKEWAMTGIINVGTREDTTRISDEQLWLGGFLDECYWSKSHGWGQVATNPYSPNVLASLLAACCPTWWWNTQNLYGGGWSHRELSPIDRWHFKFSTDAWATDTQPSTPMKSKVTLPLPGEFQRADLYSRKRWQRVHFLVNEFWVRWRKDYLQTLQPRQRWVATRRNLQVGDIVIIKDDNLPRNC